VFRWDLAESVSKSWIVFRHKIVAKLTSAADAENSAAEDLAKLLFFSRSWIDEYNLRSD